MECEKNRVLQATTEYFKKLFGEFNGKSPYNILFSERRKIPYMVLKDGWTEVNLLFEDDIVYIGLDSTNCTLAISTTTGEPYRKPDSEAFTQMQPIVSWLVSVKKLNQKMINDAFEKFKIE